jgi:hypothetical protein
MLVSVQNNSMVTNLLGGNRMLTLLKLKWMRMLGSLANLAGLPGFARDCEYDSKAMDTRVTVRNTGLYTIITVNGVDVFFYRLTGGIDGVCVTRKV